MFLLPLLFWLIALGLIISTTAGPWGQVGRLVEVAGFIAVFALALRPVADFLLRPLESRYPVLDIDALLKQSEVSGRAPPDRVVVLGAGDRYHRPGYPAIAHLQPTSLIRLAEGMRIVRRLPNACLVTCAFSPASTTDHSWTAEAARELGVDRVIVASTTDPPSTRSELKAIKESLSTRPFVLVTSAAHMPRVVELCEAIGLRPLPAPTDFLARQESNLGLRALRPTLQSIAQSERAAYEHFARLRGKPAGDR